MFHTKKAVIDCCKILNERLDQVRGNLPAGYTWHQLVQTSLMSGVDLTVRNRTMVPKTTPFTYDAYGCAVSEALLDVLTGETQILRVDMLYDCGQSMNTTIDIGQAEGAFVMGMGFWLFEKPKYDPKTGVCITNGTWEYKPPLAQDIPVDFRITLLDKSINPKGILGSKAVGEPPLCLSPCVFFSLKNAIDAARKELGFSQYFDLNSPASYDVAQQKCLVEPVQFKLSDDLVHRF
jgi:xanthine dehydrogenase/oxidase